MINFFGSACSWSSSCFQHLNGLHFKAPGPHPCQLHTAPRVLGALGKVGGLAVISVSELPSWELHPKTGTCGAHPPHRSFPVCGGMGGCILLGTRGGAAAQSCLLGLLLCLRFCILSLLLISEPEQRNII